MKAMNSVVAVSENSLRLFFENYFFNLFLCLIALFVYSKHPWFSGLRYETLFVLKFEFALFALLYPIIFVLRIRKEDVALPTKFESIKSLFCRNPDNDLRFQVSAGAKNAILSYLVKFFFLPLMVNFCLEYIEMAFFSYLKLQAMPGGWIPKIINNGFDLILNCLFVVDTFVFAVGYSIEGEWLGSKIKSVEPTMFGWVVALACYPPFNDATAQILPLSKDAILFTTPALRNALDVIVLSMFAIYVWASVALGFKASNLTNRGIVCKGPYRFCRHPAYIAKNIAWWLQYLPFMTWLNAIGLLGGTIIYFLRAATEERHLRSDPDYLAYCEKVKWKFIPGVY